MTAGEHGKPPVGKTLQRTLTLAPAQFRGGQGVIGFSPRGPVPQREASAPRGQVPVRP